MSCFWELGRRMNEFVLSCKHFYSYGNRARAVGRYSRPFSSLSSDWYSYIWKDDLAGWRSVVVGNRGKEGAWSYVASTWNKR